jgi:hypothetical protein
MKKTVFVTAVWGREFTFQFINFCLPSLLSPGNLPSLLPLAPVEFWIYTSRADGDRIEACPAYRRLLDVARPKVVAIDDDSVAAASGNQDLAYKLMVEAHRHAIKTNWGEDAALCIISPDTIIGDGSFAHVAALAQRGKRCVLMAGISLVMQSFLPALIKAEVEAGRGNQLLAGELTLQARPAVRLAMDHIHDHSGAHIIDAEGFTHGPSQMYWRLGGHGLLLRSWHPTPYFIHPCRDGSDFTSSWDGDFVARVVDYEDCEVVEDSDEFLMIEPMSFRRRRNDKAYVNPARPYDIAQWAFNNAGSYHRRFVRKKVWLHDGTLDQREVAGQASDAFLEQVFSYLRTTEQFTDDLDQGFTRLLGAPLA